MNIVRYLSLQSMRKNKTTTVVTILGIIMSLALITGLFLFANSLLQFLHDDITLRNGDSHFILHEVTSEELTDLPNRDIIESETAMAIMGVELFESDVAESYYPVFGTRPNDLKKVAPVKLMSGRLPEKPGEAIISDQVNTYRTDKIELGDTITLDLHRGDQYLSSGDPLEFDKADKQPSVTVVGVTNNPLAYPMGGPAIFVYQTDQELAQASHYWVGLRIKHVTTERIFQFWEGIENADIRPATQTNLLEYYPSVQSQTRTMVKSFAMVLVVIAAIAGISLIQNGFLISMSQRMRELSVLSSIGMTRRQKWYMSLTEGIFLYALALPIGLGSGFLAMMILFKVLTPILQRMVGTTAVMGIVWDVPTLVQIILAGFITVMIATIIPAIRTSKQTPLAGVRRQEELIIKADKLRSPWYVKLFGLEGEIAWKNLRRNRQRYRGTLISLVLSLVLYLSLASLMHYTDYSTDVYMAKGRDDIMIYNYNNESFSDRDQLESLLALDGVEEGFAVYNIFGSEIKEQELLSPEVVEQFGLPYVQLISFDDGTMEGLLDEWQLTPDDLAGNNAVLINQFREAKQGGGFTNHVIFRQAPSQMDITLLDSEYEEQSLLINIIQTQAESQLPLDLWNLSARLVVSSDTLERLVEQTGTNQLEMNLRIRSNRETHEQLLDQLFLNMQERGIPGQLNDIRAQYQSQRDLMLIGKILFFGFATILALISLTNIYNTLISSLRFRRKEFAMLRSIGMEEKSFRRMIRFESYFYAFKLLLYGIPLGLLSSFVIHRQLISVTEFSFRIPLLHFAMASLVVTAVLILIMNLGSKEARRGNILDTLKMDMEM